MALSEIVPGNRDGHCDEGSGKGDVQDREQRWMRVRGRDWVRVRVTRCNSNLFALADEIVLFVEFFKLGRRILG